MHKQKTDIPESGPAFEQKTKQTQEFQGFAQNNRLILDDSSSLAKYVSTTVTVTATLIGSRS